MKDVAKKFSQKNWWVLKNSATKDLKKENLMQIIEIIKQNWRILCCDQKIQQKTQLKNKLDWN